MAIVKKENPTTSTAVYVPTIETDYNRHIAVTGGNLRGHNSLTLSNWDGTSNSAPVVLAGSMFESNGVLYEITTNQSITAPGAASDTFYLMATESGGTITGFRWDRTVTPTWDGSLNGWYDTGERFTGHVINFDGSSVYSRQREYKNHQNGDYDLLPVGGITTLGFGQTLISGSSVSTQYAEHPKGLLYLPRATVGVLAGTGSADIEAAIVAFTIAPSATNIIKLATETVTLSDSGTTVARVGGIHSVISTGNNYGLWLDITSHTGTLSVTFAQQTYGYGP